MSVYKRKERNGKVVGWRAVVRIKGYPTVCKQCDRKEEALDWEHNTSKQIKSGQFQFDRQHLDKLKGDSQVKQTHEILNTNTHKVIFFAEGVI